MQLFNNPYNLIPDGTPEPFVEEEFQAAPSREAPVAEVRVRPREEFASAAEPKSSYVAPLLVFDDAEARDLAAIVDLRQQSAPAKIRDRGFQARVQLARSAAFEARIREQLSGANAGPVVLFTADGESGGAFYGNLTFVQGGMAFNPDQADASQLGVIRGRLGAIPDGSRVLGYVVLPSHLDLTAPIDIYWNDLMVTATLQP